MNLGDIGEFGLISRLRARWPSLPEGAVIGPGDDTAVIRPDASRLLLYTVDAMVEDIHFRRRWMSPRDLGWKAMAQSISDIAAMGGRPTHALVCLSLPVPSAVEGPADLDATFVDALYDGLDEAAARYGAGIIGGDIVGSSGGIAISVSLLGEVEEGMVMRRSGARVGDILMVTGALGDSAAGLHLLEKGEKPSANEEQAIARHLRPAPRLDEARLLARSGQVTAAIDVSDGLAGDATHVAEESGVGVRICEERVPVGASCISACQRLELNAAELALRGGEDYELLVAVQPEAADGLAELLHHETGTRLTAVGEVVARERGLTLVRADGAETPLQGAFDHFGQR